MAHPFWPFFDLRVVTPRLELRYIDDELASALAALAAKGVHSPDFMPFALPWTDVPSPQQERNTLQFYWRTRAELSPESWNMNFAVIAGGEVVGTTGLMARDFPGLRQFESGSWLGLEHQGKGIGKEMRRATLHLGFEGWGAQWATTAAWEDNGPSLGVTRSLGYEQTGTTRDLRREAPANKLHFAMSRDQWAAHLRRDDITLHGVAECLPVLGLE